MCLIFRIFFNDVSKYSDEDIKGSLQTRIMLTLLRDMVTKNGLALRKSIERALYYLLELEDKETAVGYLETMLRYIFSTAKDLTEKDAKQIQKTLETAKFKGSEFVVTLADIWREQGREEGIEIGKAQAMSNMAIFLLKNKLGTLPEDLEVAILKADISVLEQLLTKIFTIENIDDVKQHLN